MKHDTLMEKANEILRTEASHAVLSVGETATITDIKVLSFIDSFKKTHTYVSP